MIPIYPQTLFAGTLFAGGIETLLGEGYNKIDFVGRIKITYLHVLIPSEKSESC